MLSLTVNASSKYDITVTDTIRAFREKCVPYMRGRNVAVVTDSNVNALYGDALSEYLSDKTVLKIVIPAGEDSKNGENYFKILNALAENGFDRDPPAHGKLKFHLTQPPSLQLGVANPAATIITPDDNLPQPGGGTRPPTAS